MLTHTLQAIQKATDQFAATSKLLEHSELARLATETTAFQDGLTDQLAATSKLLEHGELARLAAETAAFQEGLTDQIPAISKLLEHGELGRLAAETAAFQEGIADQLAATSKLLEHGELARLAAETAAFQEGIADQLAATSKLLEHGELGRLAAETTAFQESIADQLAATAALLEHGELARLAAETAAFPEGLADRLDGIRESLASEQNRNRDDVADCVDGDTFEVGSLPRDAQDFQEDGKCLVFRYLRIIGTWLSVFQTIDACVFGGTATPALREAAIKAPSVIKNLFLLLVSLLAATHPQSSSSARAVPGPEALCDPAPIPSEVVSERRVDAPPVPIRDKDR